MIDSNSINQNLNNTTVLERLKNSNNDDVMKVVESSQTLNDENGHKNHQEQEEQDQVEEDIDNISTVGYISVKDFAYDESNPLHYGYFEDEQDFENEHSNNNDDSNSNNIHTLNGSIITTEVIENHNVNEEYDNGFSQRPQSLMIPDDYIINQKAIALYDFEPENNNELELKEGDIVFINYRHGQGWLVAENLAKTKTGFVPEEFVSFLDSNQSSNDNQEETNHKVTDIDNSTEDIPRPFYLTELISKNLQPDKTNDEDTSTTINNKTTQSDDEWEDIQDDFDEKLTISEERKL
ncbi:adaptor protein NBP2 PWA37_003520 [Arxiozyma heterogenica]|uniref:adaptor protein NBP2 n=1 Tax=Arxiozyma heterogenica TaxID=278026 RepID=UPI002F2405CF